MITQPELFTPHANTATRQRELFDGFPVLVGVTCAECGAELIETAGGYWSCPIGHGRLDLAERVDVPAEMWNGE